MSLAAAVTPPQADLPLSDGSNQNPTLTLVLTEEPGGTPTAARLSVTDEDLKSFRPFPDSIGIFHTPLGGFFYADSAASFPVNEALLRIRATHGPEFRDVDERVTITNDTTIAVGFERWIDMRALGWVCGDNHVHLRHPPSNYDLGIAEAASMARAEGLHVANFLEEDGYLFSGAVDPASDARAVLFVGQEYRSAYFGHVGLIGIDTLLNPWGDTGWPLTARTTLSARGHASALAVFAHPLTTLDYANITEWPGSGLGRGLWVDAGVGALDAIDVLSYSNLAAPSGFDVDSYQRLWNAGFAVAASAGADANMGAKASRPLGGCRVYVRVPDAYAPPQALYDSWVEAQRRGRTFITTGPLLTSYDAGGAGVGETLSVASGMPLDLPLTARVESSYSLATVQIVVNGAVVQNVSAPGATAIDVSATIPIRQSSWIAVRHVGPSQSTFLPFSQAILQTTPTLVLLHGDGLGSSEDAAHALTQIDRLDTLLVELGSYPNPEDSVEVWAGLDSARAAWTARGNAPPGVFHLLAPDSMTVVPFVFPLLEWSAATDPDSSGAVTYRLVLATDPDFDSVLVDTSGIAGAEWTTNALSGVDGTYWWRVQATDARGDKRWAQEIAWGFAVMANPAVGVPSGPPPPGADGTSDIGLSVSPNPASAHVLFRIAGARNGPSALRVFDLAGRLVRAFRLPPGVAEVLWDATDESGRRVASGAYIARLTAGGATRSAELVVLR